ncbi:unnamed protein product, partial [Gadus morhua 'NCC']
MVLLVPGHDVKVPRRKLKSLRTTNSALYIGDLAVLIYGRETLSNSSLTGRQSGAHKEVESKPQLDNTKLDAILVHVQAKFPDTTIQDTKRSSRVPEEVTEELKEKVKERGMLMSTSRDSVQQSAEEERSRLKGRSTTNLDQHARRRHGQEYIGSLVNHDKFKETQKQLGLQPSELVQLSKTRWSCQLRSINAMIENFPAVLTCLSNISNPTA